MFSGLVGLSLSYAFALTGTQVFLSRWYGSLANYIISVERIKQFMHIPPEPPAVVEDKRPPPSWPSKGRIELLDLKVGFSSKTYVRGIIFLTDKLSNGNQIYMRWKILHVHG